MIKEVSRDIPRVIPCLWVHPLLVHEGWDFFIVHLILEPLMGMPQTVSSASPGNDFHPLPKLWF